jgi:hypothetical protein
MRKALASFCLALSLLAFPAAAQTPPRMERAPPGAPAAQLALGSPLQGTWALSGPLTINMSLVITQTGDELTGTLGGQPCIGRASGARFTMFCKHPWGLLAVLSGALEQHPPVATQRSRVAPLYAMLRGKIQTAPPGVEITSPGVNFEGRPA